MHLEPSRTVLGVNGSCCRRGPRLTILFRHLQSLARTGSASRSREALLLVAAMEAAGEVSPMQLWTSVPSSVIPLMLLATRKCIAPSQRARCRVGKSS